MTLSKPPIKEAILEVLFDHGRSIEYSEFKQFREVLGDEFYRHENLVQIGGTLSDSISSVERKTIGIAFYTKDNVSIQARENGFAFSFLNQKYTSWDSFYPEAIKFLDKYIIHFRPQIWRRFSLRFINEFILEPGETVSTYLTIVPPNPIQKPLISSFIRMEVFDAVSAASGVINELLQVDVSGQQKLYLDIDVIKNVIPTAGNAIIDMRDDFAALRTFKNEIFFASITPFAIDKYNSL
ncbi:TIGR04255 family protein [Flavitalea sp.]|nr:TIGR04255 family protein [Flavitalea sp.]